LTFNLTAPAMTHKMEAAPKSSELPTVAVLIPCHNEEAAIANVVRQFHRYLPAADIYVMVDGDGTYPAEVVERLIEPICLGAADMVVGSRLHHMADSEFRSLNRLGNRLFRLIINTAFRVRLTDLLSGYR